MSDKPLAIHLDVPRDDQTDANHLAIAALALQGTLGLLESVQDASGDLPVREQADLIAILQDARYRLGQVEVTLSTTLGKSTGKITGDLSDGRQFTIARAADRRAWDHEEWKRDARRNIVAMTLEGLPTTDGTIQVIHDATGEVMEVAIGRILHEAIAAAQEVHGSTAPRSTSLKALGLYASDYCESSPAGWRFNAIRPTTTEQENKP